MSFDPTLEILEPTPKQMTQKLTDYGGTTRMELERIKEGNDEEVDFNKENEDIFVVDDYGIDRVVNRIDDERFKSMLHFHVQELGCVKKIDDYEMPLYIPGTQCEAAMKDIVKYVKRDDPESQVCRSLFGKWESLKNDFLPLFCSNLKNEKMTFWLLILLNYMTGEIEDGADFKESLQKDLNEYKESFATKTFSNTLISVMKNIVKMGDERSEKHTQILELCISLIRNVLGIKGELTINAAKSYKNTIQLEMYKVYSRKGGIFDSLVYCCINAKDLGLSKMNLCFLEAFYFIFSSFPASFIFSENRESEFLKEMREREKALKRKRINKMSTRHSRFGATIEVKRKIGNSSMIISNIREDFSKVERHGKQRYKPKPNKRTNKGGDSSINHIQIIPENCYVLTPDEKDLQRSLKKFTLDFLENSFENLININFNEIEKNSERLLPKDIKHFFYIVSFGLECFALEIEEEQDEIEEQKKSKAGLMQGSTTKGAAKKNKVYFRFIVSALQTSVLDLLYKNFVIEVSKKKTEFETKNFHSCINLFYQFLRVTYCLSRAQTHDDVNNSKILMRTIFSKDFSKVLKIGLDYFNPRVHRGSYGRKMILSLDLFMALLGVHAGSRVLTVKTNKRVKNKFARKLKNLKKVMKEREGEGEQPFENANGEDDIVMSDEEEDEMDDFVFEERKFNYQTELAQFTDYPTISKILYLIRGDSLLYNSKKLNRAIVNFISRIVDDLEAIWIFYQMDFLTLFYELITNETLRTKKSFTRLSSIVDRVIVGFFEIFEKNELISVESLFRFPNISTKDLIFNNYELHHYGNESEIEDNEEEDYFEEEKELIWTNEQDMILVNNFDLIKQEKNGNLKETHVILANMLKEIGFNAKGSDVRTRVKLLGLKDGKDIVLKRLSVVRQRQKISMEEATVRLLLYTISTSRKIELKFIDFLKEVVEDFESYQDIFPLANKDYAIVPRDKDQLKLLDFKFVYSVFVALGFNRPKTGCVYWRIPSFYTLVKLKEKFGEFLEQYEHLKDLPEKELLGKGDYAQRYRPKPKRVKNERKERRKKKPRKLRNLEERASRVEYEKKEEAKKNDYFLMGEDDDFLDINSGSRTPDKKRMKLEELNKNLAELNLDEDLDLEILPDIKSDSENNSNRQNLQIQEEAEKPKSRLKRLSKLKKVSNVE